MELLAERLTAEVTIWINIPIEKTWEAVTSPQALNDWYAPGSTWEIEKLEASEPLWFHHKSGATVDGEIESVKAPYQFRLRWFPLDLFSTADHVTNFLLAKSASGTRVTMQVYETPDENLSDVERQQNREQLEAGYTMSMENLKALLEGQPIPHVA